MGASYSGKHESVYMRELVPHCVTRTPNPGIYFPICALITEPTNVGQSRFQLNDGSVTAP
jgi:hypothetical protein